MKAYKVFGCIGVLIKSLFCGLVAMLFSMFTEKGLIATD